MPNFVGLDIETTGLHPDQDHRLIQIGIHLPDHGATYISDICPLGRVNIDEEALGVNGFTLERIMEGTPNDEADEDIATWLKSKGIEHDSLVAVGFNVGWFDQHGFLKRELPETFKFFSRRSVDLTGITYLISEITGKTRETVKEDIRTEVSIRMGGDAQWHDAGYDARAAIETFTIMQDMLEGAFVGS